MGFETFRNSRGVSAKFNDILQKSNEKKTFDDGTWHFKLSKDIDSAVAVIRLLPSKDGEDLPYVYYQSHFFMGDGGKYCIVNKCPRSFGFENKCPICERNHELWESGIESNRNIARTRKAKKNYLFNIYIVDDKLNPSNNGTVQVFNAPPSVYKMIIESMEGDEFNQPKRPFDIYDGNNFILRIYRDAASGFQKYDKSKFDERSTDLTDSEEKLKEIYEQMVDLKEFVKRDVLSTDEIERRAAIAYANSIPHLNGYDSSSLNDVSVIKQAKQPEQKTSSVLDKLDEIPFEVDEHTTITHSEEPHHGYASEDDMNFWENLANKI